MSKALHCYACNSIITLNPDSSLTKCYCGKVEGWYRDPEYGIAILNVNDDDKSMGDIVSFHNGYINDGVKLIPRTYHDPVTGLEMPYQEAQIDGFWKNVHEQACITPRAPETVRVFDTGRRACPMAIIQPGTTADTQWATNGELLEKRKQ